MLAPLVMDLADKGIPVKIVSLGHRSGAVIMVRTDSPYRRFEQLAGKRIAIPSRFAVDFLFLRKMLARENMTPNDVEIVEMAPPDMPAALYANAVDAYCTGEPFGAAAQRAGYAIPLRMTRDEWRNYICCVLTVREELIQENRPLVQDLVDHVLAAGTWLDAEAGEPRQGGGDRRRPRLLQPGPEHPEVRDGESDGPGHLRRPAHDPGGVRGADAALDRGRHAQASGPVRPPISTRASRAMSSRSRSRSEAGGRLARVAAGARCCSRPPARRRSRPSSRRASSARRARRPRSRCAAPTAARSSWPATAERS